MNKLEGRSKYKKCKKVNNIGKMTLCFYLAHSHTEKKKMQILRWIKHAKGGVIKIRDVFLADSYNLNMHIHDDNCWTWGVCKSFWDTCCRSRTCAVSFVTRRKFVRCRGRRNSDDFLGRTHPLLMMVSISFFQLYLPACFTKIPARSGAPRALARLRFCFFSTSEHCLRFSNVVQLTKR